MTARASVHLLLLLALLDPTAGDLPKPALQKVRRQALRVARADQQLLAASTDSGQTTTGVMLTAFQIINNVAGAGILTLSAGMAAGVGWMPAVAICIVLGAISGYTFFLLGEACALTGTASFKDLWSATMGADSSWIVDLCIGLMCLSCAIIYSGILGDVFTPLLDLVRRPTPSHLPRPPPRISSASAGRRGYPRRSTSAPPTLSRSRSPCSRRSRSSKTCPSSPSRAVRAPPLPLGRHRPWHPPLAPHAQPHSPTARSAGMPLGAVHGHLHGHPRLRRQLHHRQALGGGAGGARARLRQGVPVESRRQRAPCALPCSHVALRARAWPLSEAATHPQLRPSSSSPMISHHLACSPMISHALP